MDTTDSTAGPSRSRRPRHAPRAVWMLLAASALLIIAGIVAFSIPVPATGFGWFAYAPLADEIHLSPDLVYLGGWRGAGALAVGVGLLGLAFWAGFWSGRRRRLPAVSAPGQSAVG